ncbi:hypothetical protein ACTXT7_007425 [Hymenolepis weldensis]
MSWVEHTAVFSLSLRVLVNYSLFINQNSRNQAFDPDDNKICVLSFDYPKFKAAQRNKEKIFQEYNL